MNRSLAPNGYDIGTDVEGDSLDTLHSRIGFSCWLGLIAVTGFVGNMVVVVAVALYPKLRTVTNVYVLSLAVADLLTCTTIPFIVVGMVSTTGWPLSDASCVAVAIVSFVCGGSSIWHLTVIGLNRMVLITMSTARYQKVFTRCNVVIFLALTWLIPLNVIIVPFAAGLTRLGYDFDTHMCSDHEENEDGSENLIHTYMASTFLTCIPLAIVLLFYVRIFMFVRHHSRKQREWKSMKRAASTVPTVSSRPAGADVAQATPGHNDDDNTAPPTTSGENREVSKSWQTNNKIHSTTASQCKFRHSLEYRITKNAFIVVLGFLCCIIPYGICVLGQYGPEGVPMGQGFLLFNSCLNPVIYGTKHPQFRAAMKNILTGRLRAPLVMSNSVGPSTVTNR
ncbi:G-protein coupled receptor moody-like [Diadema antillarum]|uniref:G-protein coupled receptor moody-like n=1 Tax=Diadema antillarum TaxID=105358 RepID=UPI003A878A9B